MMTGTYSATLFLFSTHIRDVIYKILYLMVDLGFECVSYSSPLCES